MFEIQNYAGFIAAVVVFQLIPGPSTLAILSTTARYGIRAGMGVVGGTLLGDLVFMSAAVIGLAAVLAAHPAILTGLQWFGIAYLAWIGVSLLRAPLQDTATTAARRSAWLNLRQGLLVALTNPKTIMFFMAFFPLFLTPTAGAGTLTALIAHVTLLSLLYQTGLVLIGNGIARRLGHIKQLRQIAMRLAGVALIGFGVRLALEER